MPYVRVTSSALTLSTRVLGMYEQLVDDLD